MLMRKYGRMREKGEAIFLFLGRGMSIDMSVFVVAWIKLRSHIALAYGLGFT